jgi:amidase
LLTEDVYGNPLHQRLSLKVEGGALTGTLGRRPIQGTVAGRAIQFALKDDDSTDEFTGTYLANFKVPVRPMLGCVAVAPGFGSAAPPTGDSGRYGGNMDFNEIVEGATVYLPVAQPGALLYVGDGHAVQGDGELNGNALQTSMDVEFTVDVIPNKPLATPRVESSTHVMAVGLGGSLEDALRAATAGLAEWLEQDHHLTAPEIAMVLGS